MKYEKGSFIIVPNKEALRLLSVGARAVFLEICDFADERGRCFPARQTLAERILMHPNSVDRFIEELEEAGLIEKSGRVRADGSRTSNEYQILVRGITTHSEGPLTTHSEAELYPVLTQPTISEAGASRVVIEDVSETETKKEKRDTSYLQVFELFGNPYPLAWKANRTQIQAAKNLLAERGITDIEEALSWYNKHKEDPYCPVVNTPYDLDSKWAKLEAHYERIT